MFGFRCLLRTSLDGQTTICSSLRYLRTRWEQGYLKDLYHRRVLFGSDPLLHRSAYPNWDYDSEMFAFGHRIGVPDLPPEFIVRALTDPSFHNRADVIEECSGAQPTKGFLDDEKESNSGLFAEGDQVLQFVVLGYLRYAMPFAPEELIQAVMNKITSEEALAQVASGLGFQQIIRTAEFPPNQSSLANAFKSLLAVMLRDRAERLVVNTVIPQILDIDFVEVYPLNDPLGVITDILKAKGVKEIRPRIMHSAGEVSAEPVYLVGIFADGILVGKSPGETVTVAVDMAARDALLNEWQITSEWLLPLGAKAHSINFADFQNPNFLLGERCQEKTDLSISAFDGTDPLEVTEVAQRYWKEVLPIVGMPLRRRLRHKFSRGSITRRNRKRVLMPKPYTVC